MRIGDAEERARFREAWRRRLLLVDDTQWKIALQEGFRSNFVRLTDVFGTIFVYCFLLHPRNIYDKKIEIILQDFRLKRVKYNSAMLQTEQNSKAIAFLEVWEYLQENNSQKLPAYELSHLEQTILQLNSSSTEAS